MKASCETIKEGDTIIFSVDEYRNGRISQFDGNVLWVRGKEVEVIYLSGYRSRNDAIPFSDVIAKVDKSQPWVSLDKAPYSGNFIVFEQEN